MTRNTAGESGFTLIELLVCVALLLLGAVAGLSALPVLLRNGQQNLMRDTAVDVAHNALARIRAGVAYAPSAPAPSGHAWGLRNADTYVSRVRFARSFCGGNGAATTDVDLTVSTTYDAASDAVRIAVTYPPNPCDLATTQTVQLAAQLTPPAYAPQTQLQLTVPNPSYE